MLGPKRNRKRPSRKHMRLRFGGAVVVVACVSASLVARLPVPRAATLPSLRMISTRDHITLEARTRGQLRLDLGVWIASVNGDLQVRLTRPNYVSDVSAAQTTPAGAVLREIPIENIDLWSGFARFLHVSIKNKDGRALYRTVQSFCPNGWDQERVDDTGPLNPTYPQLCGTNPFTLGVVWGINRGWATNPLQSMSISGPDLPPGSYEVRIWIDPTYIDLFEIAPQDASARVALTIAREQSTRFPSAAGSLEARSLMLEERSFSSGAIVSPPPDAVPDLVALPAWSISVRRFGRRDFLIFAATVWNAGPSPMIVEGYRQTDQDVMEAWQYFSDASGDIIGKAAVGQLKYDSRPGHEHWHFEQFVEYSLTDGTKVEIVRSKKASFCLDPTEPIDLLLGQAGWIPQQSGLSACGEPGSLWVREVLPVGWGDTYFQSLPGQSLDITDLPNGRYFIRIHANPLGVLFDRTTSDDIAYRRVRLRGKPGHRYVIVPPFQGIDTE
jgi:hypothetical protein